MGTTANFVLPYPEPTDPIADGADAIRALATDVDTKLLARVGFQYTWNGAASPGVNIPFNTVEWHSPGHAPSESIPIAKPGMYVITATSSYAGPPAGSPVAVIVYVAGATPVASDVFNGGVIGQATAVVQLAASQPISVQLQHSGAPTVTVRITVVRVAL